MVCRTYSACIGKILFPTIQASKTKLDVQLAISILMENLKEDNRLLKIQQEILQDPLFLDALQRYSHLDIETQLDATREDFERTFSQLESEYFRERLKDISDVCMMLKRVALNMSISYPEEECILYVEEISPYDILHLPKNIKGLVIKNNSMQTHTSILLKEQYIPFANGVDLHDHLYKTCLFFDGKLYINPTELMIGSFMKYQSKLLEQTQFLKLINLSSTKIPSIRFDGIGLFRTEMYALQLGYIPSLEEQCAYYKQLDIGKMVRLRLFDFGDDKRVDNSPYRGFQYLKMNEPVLETQLKGILMCDCPNFEILIPMVTSVEDVRFIKDKVNQLCEKFGYKPLKIGCMIETPAAVFDLTRIIQEVDFINIGTNDLTKFTFATERECPVYDNEILEKVLDYIIGVAKEHEKPYYICGELYKERN